MLELIGPAYDSVVWLYHWPFQGISLQDWETYSSFFSKRMFIKTEFQRSCSSATHAKVKEESLEAIAHLKFLSDWVHHYLDLLWFHVAHHIAIRFLPKLVTAHKLLWLVEVLHIATLYFIEHGLVDVNENTSWSVLSNHVLSEEYLGSVEFLAIKCQNVLTDAAMRIKHTFTVLFLT